MRILFVDDDEVTLFLYRRLVKNKTGLEVRYARNGAEALDWIREDKEPVDLIFLDLNMPVMNGIEFLHQHAQLPSAQQCRNIVIMLGTTAKGEVDQELRKFPILEEVNKPLREDRFSALMGRISG